MTRLHQAAAVENTAATSHSSNNTASRENQRRSKAVEKSDNKRALAQLELNYKDFLDKSKSKSESRKPDICPPPPPLRTPAEHRTSGVQRGGKERSTDYIPPPALFAASGPSSSVAVSRTETHRVRSNYKLSVHDKANGPVQRAETEMGGGQMSTPKQDKNQNGSETISDLVSLFSSARLRPIRQRTRNAIMRH